MPEPSTRATPGPVPKIPDAVQSTLWLAPSTFELLREAAQRTGRTRSEIADEAIRRYLASN